MPACEVLLQTEDAGAQTALSGAWIYWREGHAFSILRTDATGRVRRLRGAADVDASHPWEYTDSFSSQLGLQVQLAYSLGATPLTKARIDESAGFLLSRTLEIPEPGALPETAVPVSPNQANTVIASPTAMVTLPLAKVALTSPQELFLWPLLWEPVPAEYFTDNLNQGSAIFNASGALTVTEHQAPPAASRVPIRERGLRVEGTMDTLATGVRVQVQDAAGNLLEVKSDPAASGTTAGIPAALAAASGGRKPFSATVLFQDANLALGRVQIVVRSEGMTPPVVAGFMVLLTGVQAVLVDDHRANPDGATAGPVPTPASLIEAQGRARRMNSYQFVNRDRLLDPTRPAGTDNPLIPTPQMPLWMAEAHLVGAGRAQLEDLLLRRRAALPAGPSTLSLRLEYHLRLAWDGPDSGTTSPRRYTYSREFAFDRDITLTLGTNDRLEGVDADGRLTAPATADPAPVAFPVATRRAPRVFVDGKTRRWGRGAGTRTLDTLVAEWQPAIVDGNREILRGGDGTLSLRVSVEAARIHGGMVHTAGAFTSPAVVVPDASPPTFRVRGDNPASPADGVIDAMVIEYYNGHSTLPRIALLTLTCWRETVRRILAHEAGHQFEHRGTTRRRFAGQFYGHEQDMPIFGAPHGYGYGQHDNPRVSDDGAWSFLENIRESVRRIMEDKATSAYNHIDANLPNPLDQRIRAVYQREIVRRFNGGSEFQWSGTAWQIHPSLNQWEDNSDHSKGPNLRLPYPNNVLGTTVTYSTGSGAASVFPWPMVFQTAQFGPGT